MKKRTKVVRLVTPEESRELARFTLDKGRVRCAYKDELFRREIEGIGLCTAEHDRLTPKDGQAFFDALDIAYANSSTRVVEHVDA